jgi:TRAF-interacting protein
VTRLYFQSIGDLNDQNLSQKPAQSCGESPEALRIEVKRLENKVSGLNSAVERQQKDLEQVNEELCICKEQLKKETSLKIDALKQKTTIQLLLNLRAGELDRSSSECVRLQERNMALAKELAALKLVSDLNLEEDEILKFASLGKEGNTKETIDVLRKSLVIRNKSYKELMAKCNSLGRGEARSTGKLDKAEEKIKKLKSRVQELEKAVEVKDNEILRALKPSKKSHQNLNSPPVVNSLHEDPVKEPATALLTVFDICDDPPKNSYCSMKTEKSKYIEDKNVIKRRDDVRVADKNRDTSFHVDKAADVVLQPLSDQRVKNLQHEQNKDDMIISLDDMDNDVFWLDETTEDRPSINIRKETSLPLPVAQQGDRCFSGGLLGPDGSNWHLGKWCKKAKKNEGQESANANNGDLIAVGADGRGGKVKVLRSSDHSSWEGKDSSAVAKRCKYSAKTTNSQSRGCMQMEHFFAKAPGQ